MINFYQQGGQVSQEDPQQKIIALVQAATQGDKQAQQTIQQIKQAAEQGDTQASQVMKLIQEILQQMQQQTQKAAKGAKLNYLKQLRGECPEGMHLSYFKAGGQICKKCVKDAENKKNTPKEQIAKGGATKGVNLIKAELCGGKVKKNK